MECIRLRIQDIDFGQHFIYIRDVNGGKDRAVVLPQSVREQLQLHVNGVKTLHEDDLALGFGYVYLPEALARKKVEKESKPLNALKDLGRVRYSYNLL